MPLNPPFGPPHRGYTKEDYHEQCGRSPAGNKIAPMGRVCQACGSQPETLVSAAKASVSLAETLARIAEDRDAHPDTLASVAKASVSLADTLARIAEDRGSLDAFIGALSSMEIEILRHLSTKPILPLQLASDNLLLPHDVRSSITNLSEKGLVELTEPPDIDLVWRKSDEHAVRLSSVGLVAQQALPSI